jgi:hypothetical protein
VISNGCIHASGHRMLLSVGNGGGVTGEMLTVKIRRGLASRRVLAKTPRTADIWAEGASTFLKKN